MCKSSYLLRRGQGATVVDIGRTDGRYARIIPFFMHVNTFNALNNLVCGQQQRRTRAQQRQHKTKQETCVIRFRSAPLLSLSLFSSNSTFVRYYSDKRE